MRPLTEIPRRVGVEVMLYTKDGTVETGWIGMIPDGGWDPADRAFTDERSRYDSYEPGYTHGSLPWGSIRRGHKRMDAYLGWDYKHVLIYEDPI